MYTSSVLFITLCLVVVSAQPGRNYDCGCQGLGNGRPCGGINRGPCMIVKKKASKLVGNKLQNQVGDITDVQVGQTCSCDQAWDCLDCARGCPICCPPCPDTC
ncbi:hypothetical protein FGIG_07157 [Fasciola gigantica]|uniref:Uncharacterized protein n=1 Tax=Fasciola gigantica TaxID=46835 RepID=A0A504YV00_FASGI|nr:hypothetical protein FGIG_07157 [Fasciola gigantica]